MMMVMVTNMEVAVHLSPTYGNRGPLSTAPRRRDHSGSATAAGCAIVVRRFSVQKQQVRAAALYGALTIALFGAMLGDGSPGVMASSGNATTRRESPPPEARVDINHATIAELMKVPGMTRPWAERIVRFRPYRTKQDLLDNGIVTSEVYDRIKDYVIAHRSKE